VSKSRIQQQQRCPIPHVAEYEEVECEQIIPLPWDEPDGKETTSGSDVLSEVPYTEHYQPALINDHVQEMQYYEQLYIDESAYNGMNSDSNIIPYSQYS
ncbi:hypothetical protein Tco_0805764, partial [Tanacetum coccineum]